MPTLYNGFGFLLVLLCIAGILWLGMGWMVENERKEQ